MENGEGQVFTLGQVVGEIRALARQVEKMEDRLNDRIGEVKDDLKDTVTTVKGDLQKQLDKHEDRLGKQERANGAWRWIERGAGMLGAFISGWFGGRAGGSPPGP